MSPIGTFARTFPELPASAFEGTLRLMLWGILTRSAETTKDCCASGGSASGTPSRLTPIVHEPTPTKLTAPSLTVQRDDVVVRNETLMPADKCTLG